MTAICYFENICTSECPLLSLPPLSLSLSLSALYPHPLDLGDPEDRQCENIKCRAALSSEKITASAKDLFFLLATLR